MSAISWQIPLDSPPTTEFYDLDRYEQGADTYRLYGLWCVHLYRYRADMLINGVTIPIRPRYVSIVPPDTTFTHKWPDNQNIHISIHFRLPENGAMQTVPIIQDLGEAFESEWDEILAVRRQKAESLGPMRAKAWSLLWRLALPHNPTVQQPGQHPSLVRAQEIINEHLSEPIEVAKIAHDVGLSHNHLIRLFRATHGVTIQGYIRSRRAERARYLLTHTSRPIKAIAYSVGLPDVQSLNKTLRRVYGKSPSAIRNGRDADS